MMCGLPFFVRSPSSVMTPYLYSSQRRERVLTLVGNRVEQLEARAAVDVGDEATLPCRHNIIAEAAGDHGRRAWQ